MMRHEFIAAALSINLPLEDNPHCPRLTAETVNRWRKHGMPEAAWNTLTSCYLSRRLDSVIFGPDRHARFAQWLTDPRNFRAVYRLLRFHSRAIRRRELRGELSNCFRRIESLRADLASLGDVAA